MLVLFVSFLLVLLLQGTEGFSFAECNVTRGCWFHPPGCSETSPCTSGVEWQFVQDGILFQLQSTVSDMDPAQAHYLSVGLSLNQHMDDDTVIECVHAPSGKSTVQLSFNDQTHNSVLYQASSVLLSSPSVSFSDGILTCTAVLDFTKRLLVDEEDRWKIHDVNSNEFFLLFARGDANVFSLEKDIHSTNDGVLFPWISTEQVSFCSNCTTEDIDWIRGMKQTDVSRYWKYRIAVIHGILLLFAWWVLGSSAILMARYFKPMFPRKKLLGTAVWFQLHRDLFLFSLVLQIPCVLLIFYQSGWIWFECSYACSSDDFSKKMHAITGVFASVLAVLQPFLALARPFPDSSYRPIFNWVHWFFGMTAWCFASATFLLSLPLGKTGLNMAFGHVPNYIMGGYIITFVLSNIILEIIATSNTHNRIGSSNIALSPVTVSYTDPPLKEGGMSRLVIFGIHLVISIGVWVAISVMLLIHLYSHSP